MQPAPTTAPSHTCASFQMRVPDPMRASGETSALGWIIFQGLHNALRGPAVAEAAGGRRRRNRPRGGAGDALRVGAGEGVPAVLHRLRPLGLLAPRDAGGG